MSFILFFQFLGTHIPELGAFLLTLILNTTLAICTYKLGYHASGKAWKLQVKQMPAIIKSSIVEEFELTIARKDERIRWLEEQYRAVAPALKGMVGLAQWAAKDAE